MSNEHRFLAWLMFFFGGLALLQLVSYTGDGIGFNLRTVFALMILVCFWTAVLEALKVGSDETLD